ncbi:acyl carrier protein [Desulfoluna butyratoxydans]|uniref:acyl carrier protein n=1 Tax=Desulfoluna butyratoxydans TaxID=231438 RepID=UPI0015D1D3BD|nr:hypothetical protein [Desulfoluna butyratoxydans]
MKKYTYEELVDIVLNIIEPHLFRSGLDKSSIDSGTDLLSSGIIDSFGFLETVSAVEEQTGILVDLSALGNTSNFTTLHGFACELVRQQSN